jgi:hypothetical protein
MRRVGVLLAFPERNSLTEAIVSAFTQALEHFGWVEGKIFGSTTVSPRPIQGSLKGMRQNWSAWRRTQFLPLLHRRSLRCGGRPARYLLFSCLRPIPSG